MLIFLWIDWFDLLGVQGTLSREKHQFISALPSSWSNSHIRTLTSGKTIALTIWLFVAKIMILLFNTLSRFVIDFLPRSNHLIISWWQRSRGENQDGKD